MKFILISDYPYSTPKKFFENFRDAYVYANSEVNVLSQRIYTLTRYNETEHIVDGKPVTRVDYAIDINTKIQIK